MMDTSFKTSDFIIDGILNYGLTIGRFVFEEERKIVYALNELMHIGGSDVMMIFQVSKNDYADLLNRSSTNGLPDFPVPYEMTEKYHDIFLCGESAYCKRNSFTLNDADPKLMESY